MRAIRPPAVLLLLVTGAACVPGRPVPRDEPPTPFAFGIPSGGVAEEQWLQRRAATIHFASQPAHTTVVMLGGRTQERFEAQADGTVVVTATMLEQGASRDGVQMVPVPSFVGIPITHRVRADGTFVEGVGLGDVLGSMRTRLFGDEARLAFDAQFSVSSFESQLRRAWQARFRNACSRSIAPGDVRWDLDVQELPAGAPAVSLVRRTALGRVPDWPAALGRAPVRFFLEFGGTSSSLVKEDGAADYLARLGDEEAAALAAHVEGRGEQLIDPGTCLPVREDIRLEGSFQLDKAAARRAGIAGVPDRIEFRVDRQLVRGVPGALPSLD